MIVSDTAVNQRITVFVLTVMLIAAGLYSYYAMPREAAPEVVIPYVFVNVNYRGVSPEDMENSVTKEIEDKLKGLKNVKKVTSTSKEGSSDIRIEFVVGTDIDNAIQKVKDKVDEAKPDLPTDLDDEPSVYEINFSEMPILIVALSGTVGGRELREMAEDLEEAIEGVPGVLEVDVVGGLEREIHVEIDPNRMILYGVPFSALSSVVAGENANISGGSIRTDEGKYQLRMEGEFTSAAEAERIVVTTSPDGSPVYLGDIAEIKDGHKDLNSASRLDGRDAVSLYIKKRGGENIIRIIEDVDKVIAEHEETWPPGTKITRLSDESKRIDDMIADLENNIISGLILVIVVVCAAMGLRNAVLVSLSIPLSMLLGFVILKSLGITLNMVVLFSLTLALGMLVDNAIVIIENIFRFIQEGVPRLEAAKRATSEVAYPVIGSALTTIGAFTPLLWWTGTMGDFMCYLPLTVICVLASCLFVALVINPAMAAVMMSGRSIDGKIRTADEVQSAGEHPMLHGGGIILQGYKRLLRLALGTDIPAWDAVENTTRVKRYARHLLRLVPRMSVIVVVVLSWIFCLLLWVYRVGLVKPVEFFPSIDPQNAEVKLDFPEGADIGYCNWVAREVEKCVGDKRYSVANPLTYEETIAPKTQSYADGSTYEGPSDINGIEDSYVRLEVLGDDNKVSFLFPDFQERTESSNVTVGKIAERVTDVAGAIITVEKPQHGPPTGGAVNIEIIGDNLKTLGSLAKEAKAFLQKVPFTHNIHDDYKQGAPTLRIRVNRKRAAQLGLSSQIIGYALRAAINGVEISTYREGDDDYDIVMRFQDKHRHLADTLQRVFIPGESGQIPLTTVATIEYIGGLGEINRIDYDRVVTVSCDVDEAKTTGDTARRQAKALLGGATVYERGALFCEGATLETLQKLSESRLSASMLMDKEDGVDARLAALRDCGDDEELRQVLNAFVEKYNPLVQGVALGEELAAQAAAEPVDSARRGKIHKALALLRGGDPADRAAFNRLLLDLAYPTVLMKRQEGLDLPEGYRYRFTGEQEHQDEAKAFLQWAGCVAIGLIFLILVAQFNSIVYPFIIISSVVLSLAGVYLGLGVDELPFGVIMTGVGVISLAGVVVNNAIVLVDYILKLRERGMARDEAIIAAGATRLRPVLLTAITTVLGLIPMATGYSVDFHPLAELELPVLQTASESSLWWRSMAISVIYGLWFATILTLVVVPVLFSLLDDFQMLSKRGLAKLSSRLNRIQQRVSNRYWGVFWKHVKFKPRPGDPGRDSGGE